MIITDHHGKSHELGPNDEVFWRPSVYGLIQNPRGEYLVVRTAGKSKLEFPGGGADIQENLEQALRREFLEETGVILSEIGEIRFLGEKLAYHTELERHEHRLLFSARVVADPSTDLEQVASNYDYSTDVDFVGWIHPRDFEKHEWQFPAKLMIQHYTL